MGYVGEAVYKITYDANSGELKGALRETESQLEKTGSSSGKAFANAWTVAAGSLIAKGVNKISSTISSQLNSAISRVDTLNSFPKIMSNLGISADASSKAITKMSEKLQGLPTTLDQGAQAVQRFTSKNGDVAKSTDIFLALNNALLAGGASTEIQATALEQLSQAYAKGKPDMMEWRSAMTAMPAQLNQIAKAMGLGENAADKLGEGLRDGTISMDKFMESIVTLNTKGANGFQSFEKQAKNATGGINTSIAVMKSRITQGIAEIINTIGAENIANTIVGIGNAIKEVLVAISGLFSFISENQWVIAGLASAIAPILAMGIFGKILALTQAFNPLKLQIVAVCTAVGVLAAGATWVIENWSGITQFFGEILGSVGDFFAGMWNGVLEGAKGAWNGITSIFGKTAEFFGSVFSKAWEAVKAVFSTGGRIFMGIVEGIIGGFKAIVNAIIGGINSVIAIPFNAINGVLEGIRGIDILGIKPFGWIGLISVPQIPYLATGGIVPETKGGRLIVAGEGGQDEWVVPESKMASLIDQLNERGAGMNVTINVNGTFATSTSEQRKVAEVIAQRLQEVQKSRLNAGGTL